MITDFDKTVELLDLFDVEYEVHNEIEDNDRITTIILYSGSRKVIGYRGFFSEYAFINGKFKDIGIWE